MNRLRTAVSVMAAMAVMTSCGKESGTGPVIEPPVTYSATILSPSGGATLAQNFDAFPNALVSFSGEGKDSKGGAVSTDFSWKLDGVAVSTELSFTKSLLPGNHTVCLKVKSSTETCASFVVSDVKPITGRVFLAQSGPDGPVANLRAFAHNGSISDSVDIEPSGTFSLKTRVALLDSVMVSIRCRMDPCNWFPSVTQVRKYDLARAQNFVVLNKVWTIASGRWAQRAVPLGIERGYAPSANPNLQYFMRHKGSTGEWIYHLHTWNRSLLPIPVAFDRTGSNFLPTKEDSVFFWNALNELNNELGVQFFRPANESDLTILRGDNGFPIYQKGIGVLFRTDIANEGLGAIFPGPSLDITGGIVLIRQSFSSPVLSERQHRFLAKHEIIHALGFGHNPHESWVPGIMADYQYASDPLFGVAVAEDVAYQQAFYRVSELQKLWNAYGMPQIHQGERVFLLGLPIEEIFTNPSTSSGASASVLSNDGWSMILY